MDRLPVFPPFDTDIDKANAGPRWQRWMDRLENLFVAMELTDPEDEVRKRALLLHYVGDKVYDIYDAQKGETETTYTATKDVLTNYFRPRKNVQIEVYNFRSCSQKEGQSLDEYVTELRKLAKDCEFTDMNKELLSQVIQNCMSNQLRRRALREPDKDLDAILTLGRAMELAETQAKTMEKTQTVNAIGAKSRRKYPCTKTKSSSQINSPQKRPNELSKGPCRQCGGPFPHKNGPCPARGKTCHSCQGSNHFSKMCRSKKKRVKALQTESTDYQYDSSEDEHFHVIKVQVGNISSDKPKGPYIPVKLENRDVTLLLDSGSPVNILDESDYNKVGQPVLTKAKNRLIPYGGVEPIPVLGVAKINIETQDSFNVVDFYVVKGNSGSLLGYPIAQKLGLIKIRRIESERKVEDEFPNLFDGIGKLRDRQVKLHIDKEIPPVAQRHRRTPFHLREKVEKEINKLVSEDIIERVEGEPTPWVSPIVTPPKRDPEEIRICVDMREANKAVLRERHIMPTIEELILDLNGAQVFSKLDLKSGYHQLELEPESRYITTFSTHLGIYRYKRLNFGISSASEVFQETIRQVVQGIDGVRNISDDILVYGKSAKEHDAALRAALQRLHDSGLTLNGKKCEFRKRRISFFGVVFSQDGISPDPEKVKAVREFGRPQNVKELRSFLGMTNYCSRFIADYASICEPLRRLTHSDISWKWDARCENAFMLLKRKLSSDTVMSYYDPRMPVEVRVDASPIGLGAVLVQDKIVSYASRSLTPVESRYSQVEREALAVVWACEHFDTYLRGLNHFVVVTDHKPLEKIWEKTNLPSLRIERWGLRLQPYKFNIRYERGEDNIADYMSRHPIPESEVPRQENVAEKYVNFVTSMSLPKAIRIDEVKEATLQSPTLQKAIEFTRNGRWYEMKNLGDKENIDMEELTAIKHVRDELTVHSDNILLRDHRIVLPMTLRDRAIKIAHEGHQGIAKTKSFIRSKVWFPNIDSRIEDAVKDCIACQVLTPEPRPMEPLRMSELPAGPWENLSIDFCGPLPSGEYLFVIIDEYSRYPIVEVIRSVSANIAIPVLDKVLSTFGTPKIVKSDNGAPFNSEAFRKYSNDMGFYHRRVTPRWPRANAQAESFNKPLMKVVRAARLEEKNWRQELYRFLRQYRATPHTTTGQTPHRLMFGRDPKTKLPQTLAPRQSVFDIDEKVRQKDSMNKSKMKKYADVRNKAEMRDISLGDTVLVKKEVKENKMSPLYNPQPKVVIGRKGPMVTVSGNITRNTSRFKKINPGVERLPDKMEDNMDEIQWPDQDVAQNESPKVGNSEAAVKGSVPETAPGQPITPVLRRSTRERKPNTKYKDYVT